MIDKSDVPASVEHLLELAQHHGRAVARIHSHGWRIAITASTSVHVHWSDSKRGGRMQCVAHGIGRSQNGRISIRATRAAIIAGVVNL